MPIDDETGFQLSEHCPACDTGGDMRIGTPCRPVEADMITPPKQKTPDELVAEITALRALVSRLKRRLRTITQVADVSDDGGLPYKIH